MFECKRYHDDWGLQGAMFFSFTLVTTIGYGSFTPSTASGKWFTIFYSFFGILIFGHGVSLLLELPHSIHRYFQVVPCSSLLFTSAPVTGRPCSLFILLLCSSRCPSGPSNPPAGYITQKVLPRLPVYH